jgi:hypothetical protein
MTVSLIISSLLILWCACYRPDGPTKEEWVSEWITTDGQSVLVSKILITIWLLLCVFFCRAPPLMRGRVCHLSNKGRVKVKVTLTHSLVMARHATMGFFGVRSEEVFSLRSVPRLYNLDTSHFWYRFSFKIVVIILSTILKIKQVDRHTLPITPQYYACFAKNEYKGQDEIIQYTSFI